MNNWPLRTASTLMAIAMSLTPVVAHAQDGVPGDRLVVPLPDFSGLDQNQARDLATELAQAGLVTSECRDYDVSDPEWQLLTESTDAVRKILDMDPVAFDREFVRPVFEQLSDPAACDQMGPQVTELITQLEQMGGSASPVLPSTEDTTTE